MISLDTRGKKHIFFNLNVNQGVIRGESFQNTLCKCSDMLNFYVSEFVFVGKTFYFRLLIRTSREPSRTAVLMSRNAKARKFNLLNYKTKSPVVKFLEVLVTAETSTPEGSVTLILEYDYVTQKPTIQVSVTKSVFFC